MQENELVSVPEPSHIATEGNISLSPPLTEEQKERKRLRPMVECVVLWLEELWVEKYVEPEKRDAAFVERCRQHSWRQGGSL